jgi:xanthine dehydrogenase accessory factor
MTVAAVEATPHADVDGVRTWFCGEGCRRAFLTDPAAHA